MHMKKVIMLICALAAMLLFAGCMQPQQESVTTPTVTPVTTPPTTAQTQRTPATTPSTSVDTIPPEKAVIVTVLRDQITPKIIVRFDGGKGQQQIRSIEVKVTRSDGQVLTNTLPSRVNAELEFDGTKGVDRVEVWVSYLDGSRYKLKDELYDYYKR